MVDLKQSDSGRYVMFDKTEKGMIYYCPDRKRFFILQNSWAGDTPTNFSKVRKGFRYGWNVLSGNAYQMSMRFPDLRFATDSNIIEVW